MVGHIRELLGVQKVSLEEAFVNKLTWTNLILHWFNLVKHILICSDLNESDVILSDLIKLIKLKFKFKMIFD